MYDKEFEEFFIKIYYAKASDKLSIAELRELAYLVWKAARETKPEKKTIELEGGMYFTNIHGTATQSGQERKTEEDAIKAAELMRKRDRLAAFVYEHCGFEGEYKRQECDHYIYSGMNGEYSYVQEDEFPDLCKQYMPEDTAIWLCEKLNSGEIVL